MVATKAKKNSDVFKTVKAKVGKRAPAKANDTDTAFSAAGLHLVQQESGFAAANDTTTDRGLTWEHLSQQAHHPAAAVRRSAMTGIANLVRRTTTSDEQKKLPYDRLELLTVVAQAAIVDSDKQVRMEGFPLLQSIVKHTISLQPFLDRIVALIHSALNSLDTKQSHHGAMVVRWLASINGLLVGVKGQAIVRQLLPSLARLLGRPTGKQSTLLTCGGVAHVASIKKKKKKRKREGSNTPTNTNIDHNTSPPSCDERYDILCSVEALLQATASTPSPQNRRCSNNETPTTHAAGAILYYREDRQRRQKKPRLITTVDQLLAAQSSPQPQANNCNAPNKAPDDIIAKLRDLLFEAEPGDAQYTKAATCIQRIVALRHGSHSSILPSVVRYLSQHNTNDGDLLLQIWKLSRSLPEAPKWHKWVTKQVVRALEEGRNRNEDATVLLDVVELLLFRNDGDSEDDEARKEQDQLKAAFVECCFGPAVAQDDTGTAPTSLDWTSPYNRKVAVIGCRFLQENTGLTFSTTDAILSQLGDMLLAWQGHYPEETRTCLVAMEWKLSTSSAGSGAIHVADRWKTCLVPLFAKRVFLGMTEAIQRRLVCLVTSLSSPSPQLMQSWSSLIAADHPLSDWMGQCAHRMRKTIPMPTYLGFIIDSLGVLEADEEKQISNLDRGIRRAGWALLNCGASAKQMLSKLEKVLLMMLEKTDSSAAARVAMSLIAMFSWDLDRQGKRPLSLADIGLSSPAFQSALVKQLKLLDGEKGDKNPLLQPKVQLAALYPSLLQDNN